MNHLRAVIVAGCVMMISPAAGVAKDCHGACNGAQGWTQNGGQYGTQYGVQNGSQNAQVVPAQFDNQLSADGRKFSRQQGRGEAPDTVPLSQFNNVFQDYLNQTPGSSGADDQNLGNQFGGNQSGRNQFGGGPFASGNQFSSQSFNGNRRSRKNQIANQFDARGGGRKGGRRAKMKERFDTNGDGVLDQNERAQMHEFRKQRKGNGQNGGGMRRKGRRGRQNQGGGPGSGPGAGFSNGFDNNGFGAFGGGAGGT